MFTNHFDIFNKAINDFDGPANERESILWHENDMYDFAKAYLDGIDDMSSHDVDLTLRYMRYDIEAIQAYLETDLDTNCVMFEMLDVLSATRKELEAC